MEIVTNANSDDIECVCGNTAASSGFYAYSMGGEVEPDDSWDGVSMFCAECARVFHQDTGAVVDHPAVVVTLDGLRIEREQ